MSQYSSTVHALLTADPVRRFQCICERLGRNAIERGLTDAASNKIMAER